MTHDIGNSTEPLVSLPRSSGQIIRAVALFGPGAVLYFILGRFCCTAQWTFTISPIGGASSLWR